MQIDDNQAAIGRFDAVTVDVLGDAGVVARRPDRRARPTPTADDQRPDVAERWAIWRAEKARRVADDRGRGVSAAAVFDALSRHLPGGRGRRPSTSATTPTRSAATWSRRASRC